MRRRMYLWIGIAALAILLVAAAIMRALPPTTSSEPPPIPTAASRLMARLAWQTDPKYQYRMLVPVEWEPIDLGDSRGYMPRGSVGKTDRVLLTARNLGTQSGAARDQKGLSDLFKQAPSVAAWAEAQERRWGQAGYAFTKARTLPNGVIYAVTVSPDEVDLVAYVVDGGQPLAVALHGFGRYGKSAALRGAGLWTDFESIVGSAAALE